jgi:hypothetical protein
MKLKLILTTAIVGAALALPGVSSAWAQAPPLQDSVSLTEAPAILTSGTIIDELTATSGPSGENPSGEISWHPPFQGPDSGPITCLAVSGNAATFNYLSSLFGFIVTLQVVDGSTDTFSIVSVSRAATDCSPPGQGEFVNTYQLTSGDITVVDAQPPQAPPNDTFEQATVISSLPFSQILDTTQATTDSTDLEALAACGGPSITGAATVWYEYTPSVDQSVLILTTPVPPSYGAGVAVLTGSPGSLSAVTCFPSLGSFSATAGVTYHIVVADISGGSGGELHFSVSTPGVEIKVDRFGRFDPKTGVATATGTFTCPSGLLGQISGDLSQRTTFASTGANPIDVSCNGAAQPWSIAFTPFAKFTGGPADVSVAISVVGFPGGGVGDFVNQSVILRG